MAYSACPTLCLRPPQAPDREFLIRCSYVEIYNERIRDLLNLDPKARAPKPYDSLEGVQLKPAPVEQMITDPSQIRAAALKAEKQRSVGSTDMNERSRYGAQPGGVVTGAAVATLLTPAPSVATPRHVPLTGSRSHTIFRIVVESRERRDDRRSSEEDIDAVLVGCLTLVDLAGSESVRSTGAVRDALLWRECVVRAAFPHPPPPIDSSCRPASAKRRLATSTSRC